MKVLAPPGPEGHGRRWDWVPLWKSWRTRHRYPSQLQVLGQREDHLTRVGRGGETTGGDVEPVFIRRAFEKLRQGTWMRRNRRRKVRDGERLILRGKQPE